MELIFRKRDTVAKVLGGLVSIRESALTPVFLWGSLFLIFAWSGSVPQFFLVAGTLVVLKKAYVSFLRPDIRTDPSRYPVLTTFHHPAHGSHRGGAEEYGPENTMYSYRKSVFEYKTDLVEIDLRLSDDGHIFLMHDDDVSRTTNGSGTISTLSQREIRSLDAAYRYDELRGSGIGVPSLDEVLEEFKNEKVAYFFDIKDERVIPMLPSIIKKWNLKERLVVGAVFPSINEKIRKVLDPLDIPISPDFKTVLLMIVFYILGLSWILPTKHIMMGSHVTALTIPILSQGLISEWKSRKQRVILFGDGIDTDTFQKEFIKRGVDILLTDRPDVLRETMNQL